MIIFGAHIIGVPFKPGNKFMNSNQQISRFVVMLLVISFITSFISGRDRSSYMLHADPDVLCSIAPQDDSSSNKAQVLNNMLRSELRNVVAGGDSTKSRSIIEKLFESVASDNIDHHILTDSYYLIGTYYLAVKNFSLSIRYLELCITLKAKYNDPDLIYSKALYNLGLAYFMTGDFKRHMEYSSASLDIDRKLKGELNPELVYNNLSLGTSYMELQEYDKAINCFNSALKIVNIKPDSVSLQTMTDLYTTLGGLYIRLADYSKAKIYLEKAESLYKQSHLPVNDNYINLENSLAITYGALNLNRESEEYYKKNIAIAIASNSEMAYNIINSYSILLGNLGQLQKGENMLKEALSRAKKEYESSPRTYIEVLGNYADYLREYKNDYRKSIAYFIQCLDYLNGNEQDNALKTSVSIGYSLSLNKAGEQEKAMKVIQTMLSEKADYPVNNELYSNPPVEKIKPDRMSLRILSIKYMILRNIYAKNGDLKLLEAASNTSELIVSLLEKVRINISDESSRLILGNRYRSSYIDAIRDFSQLYRNTGNQIFLEKAFEYSEKSKVAGLLTSTRELKATELNIPASIADYEKKLQMDISLIDASLSEESAHPRPNQKLISKWKENLLEATRSRDSLILVFEKQYPVYYEVKYNTQVAEIKDIPAIVGNNANYINYVLSDSLLYTFVVNRKNQHIFALHVDSSFFKDIRAFRSLLSLPSPSDNALLKFNEFCAVGNRLFRALIDSLQPFLISNKLVISPDNILSYIPFETLPVSVSNGKGIRYNFLYYMMDDYDISYTYSATFMAEAGNKKYNRRNSLIAFAPDYPEPIDINSALMSRQAQTGVLHDLPFARQEAEYVSSVMGGKLYENSRASESVFKKECSKYEIVHLSMHTLLNDKDPMRSTLIFSRTNDSIDDGYLRTFEIYGIPLNARMVVLSSCNTGTGQLASGEGILSLARGFIYSGSQSVIMSMWEIEDKSGTEIVDKFYDNLKRGYSKSEALKKARVEFLRNSDQLRSHPYFWSALVVYGNDDPLFLSANLKIGAVILASILILSLLYYLLKRRYS